MLCALGCTPTLTAGRKGADAVPRLPGRGAELPYPPPLPPRVSRTQLPPSLGGARGEILEPGIVLRVEVSGEPAFSVARTRVGPDGSVHLPYLGKVRAQGKTPDEFGRGVAEALVARGYLRQAHVHVEVLEASGRKVYVLGRVRNPGAYDLPFDRRLTLTQVIALAGGLSTEKTDLEADPSAVRLIREEGGERKTYRISFLEIVNQGRLEADVPVLDGDVVYVPPKQELFIFGAVNDPGGFPLADGSRLGVDEALGLAGGLSENADPRGLLLIRRSAAGGETYRIPADPLERARVQITANDTIIASSRSVSRVYVLGAVNRQGGIPLEPDLTVTKALALAGGLTRVAAANSVRLIRASKDGEKRAYSVPVADIISSGDLSKDPVLSPGDLIWVPEGIF